MFEGRQAGDDCESFKRSLTPIKAKANGMALKLKIDYNNPVAPLSLSTTDIQPPAPPASAPKPEPEKPAPPKYLHEVPNRKCDFLKN